MGGLRFLYKIATGFLRSFVLLLFEPTSSFFGPRLAMILAKLVIVLVSLLLSLFHQHYLYYCRYCCFSNIICTMATANVCKNIIRKLRNQTYMIVKRAQIQREQIMLLITSSSGRKDHLSKLIATWTVIKYIAIILLFSRFPHTNTK